jgi:gliding motility-associated-like protein
LLVDKPGVYTLEVTDSKGCKGKDSSVIRVKDCLYGVFIPTGFTPDNDGRNDKFKATVYGPVQDFELTVFNRWGTIVFKSNNPDRGWDGKINGRPQDSGTFVWICKYRLNSSDIKIQKGTVMLVH